MVRPRFILSYRGDGIPSDADVVRVRELGDIVVLDSSPRMLLVEADPEPLRELVDGLPDWIMAPEQQYGVPDTRKRIAEPPG